MFEKSVPVKISGKKTSLVYEVDGASRIAYIPDHLVLLNIDGNGQTKMEGMQEFEDIKRRRISTIEYGVLGFKKYDFSLGEGSVWDDYPRPINAILLLMRRLGKRKECGKLELLIR